MSAPIPALRLVDLTKSYRGPGGRVRVLDVLNAEFARSSLTAVMGPSGGGKSTLLNCAAGIDAPDSGRVLLGDTDLATCSDRHLTQVRRTRIGFVFQQLNLLPMLTAYGNVALPLRLRHQRVRRSVVMGALEQVGLAGKERRRPAQLSGGEQQRVAIARTMAVDNEIVFADEPTGSLDRGTGRGVIRLFRELVDTHRQTVVMVTHDPAVAAAADRVLFLFDGRLVRSLEHPTVDTVTAQLATWEK
jgi:putative ABC transport system ATP-binding protein